MKGSEKELNMLGYVVADIDNVRFCAMFARDVLYKYDRTVLMFPPFNLFHSQMSFDCATHLGFTLKLSTWSSVFVNHDHLLYKLQIECLRPEDDSYIT